MLLAYGATTPSAGHNAHTAAGAAELLVDLIDLRMGPSCSLSGTRHPLLLERSPAQGTGPGPNAAAAGPALWAAPTLAAHATSTTTRDETSSCA